MNNFKISIRLNEEEYQRLNELAIKNNMSKSKVVKQLILSNIIGGYSPVKRVTEGYINIMEIINECEDEELKKELYKNLKEFLCLL